MLKEILNINQIKVLNRTELNKVSGGQWMTCTCNKTGYTFSWDYINRQQLIDDVNRRCSSGAVCKSDAALAAEE